MKSVWSAAFAAALICATTAAAWAPESHAPTRPAAEEYGVYLMLVEGAQVGFDEALETLRTGIDGAGWQLLTDYSAGVESGDCDFRAHVFVVSSSEYAAQVMAHGVGAAFALPLRVAVFEDENGVHVAAANPLSLNRTIVAEEGFGEQSQAAAGALQQMVAGFGDAVAADQFGQVRDRGLIGKTMGIIAGGPFPDKIEEIASTDGQIADVADQLWAGLEELGGERRWATRPVYRLDLPEHDAVIIGVTGDPIESKSFQIVGAGSNDARDDFACPGIDHAAAYPVELVLYQDGDRVRVTLIDEMFRMKMYFEDAGKMKFAANMRMPGSIENEIRDKVEESLY